MTALIAAPACGLALVSTIALFGATAIAEPIAPTRTVAADDNESIGTLSVAGGVTAIDTSGADALVGGGIALAAGIRLHHRLALVFDLAMMTQIDGRGDSGRLGGMQTVGVQFWPRSRVWLRAGAGVGWLNYSGGTDDAYHRSGLGSAALVAAGVQLVDRPDWSLDVQLRSALMRHYAEDFVLTHGLLVGASWH
jgi:hypothetical protein